MSSAPRNCGSLRWGLVCPQRWAAEDKMTCLPCCPVGQGANLPLPTLPANGTRATGTSVTSGEAAGRGRCGRASPRRMCLSQAYLPSRRDATGLCGAHRGGGWALGEPASGSKLTTRDDQMVRDMPSRRVSALDGTLHTCGLTLGHRGLCSEGACSEAVPGEPRSLLVPHLAFPASLPAPWDCRVLCVRVCPPGPGLCHLVTATCQPAPGTWRVAGHNRRVWGERARADRPPERRCCGLGVSIWGPV